MALPAPTSPWHVLDLPAPEDHFLRAGTCMWHWYTCLQQRLRSGGFPPMPSHACRENGSSCSSQRNPFPGHTRSTGSHSVSSMLQDCTGCSLELPVDSAAAQSHWGSLFSRCVREQSESLFAGGGIKRAFRSEPCYSVLHERGQTGPCPSKYSICFPVGLPIAASLRVSQQLSFLPFPVFSFLGWFSKHSSPLSRVEMNPDFLPYK